MQDYSPVAYITSLEGIISRMRPEEHKRIAVQGHLEGFDVFPDPNCPANVRYFGVIAMPDGVFPFYGSEPIPAAGFPSNTLVLRNADTGKSGVTLYGELVCNGSFEHLNGYALQVQCAEHGKLSTVPSDRR